MVIRRLNPSLLLAAALCVSLIGCRFEFAVDPGNLGPSVDAVHALLDQGLVRQARRQAEVLVSQYRGPQIDLVSGWALWRNGEVNDAEARFRRAADGGLSEGLAGLALVRASVGDWEEARNLARSALESDASGIAHAVLASAAWRSGQAVVTIRELRAWSATEPRLNRGVAASAMANAIEELSGAPHTWRGVASSLSARQLPDGSLAVDAEVAGQQAVLVIDLTYRQSLVSPELASAAGLSVIENLATSDSPTASSRWPAILAVRQAACPSIALGDTAVDNVLLAVGPPPEGSDGVLGMDILVGARWSFDSARRLLILAPPARAGEVDELADDVPSRVIAWLNARLIHEGLGVQLLLFPRVLGETVPAGINLGGRSFLDSDLLPVTGGSGEATLPLQLGGWRGEAVWHPTSLDGWAADGGVAPAAVLGSDLLRGWTLHWLPESRQIRIEEPVSF